ncbi:PEF-CTERM sorting domain-containing protein [Methanomethylovorans sp.]
MYKQGTEIPEFPTVALPVAVILGLAFVFMRKQE